MKDHRSFKHRLSAVLRWWRDRDYDRALAEVEDMQKAWPGCAQLHLLWAGLVQLQENPQHTLGEVKKALQHAIDLDKDSPTGPIELGHFLDAVEDNPQSASKAFAEGITRARRLLIDGLLGRAKALLQLDRREEALQCLMESMYLADADDSAKPHKSSDAAPDVLVRDAAGRLRGFRLKGPYASKFQDLLKEVLVNRSA